MRKLLVAALIMSACGGSGSVSVQATSSPTAAPTPPATGSVAPTATPDPTPVTFDITGTVKTAADGSVWKGDIWAVPATSDICAQYRANDGEMLGVRGSVGFKVRADGTYILRVVPGDYLVFVPSRTFLVASWYNHKPDCAHADKITVSGPLTLNFLVY